MTAQVLIVRPEPAAHRTAARAATLGLEPIIAPLFAIRALGWDAPAPDAVDAVMLTSASAPLHAGPQLARFRSLCCYCVGAATAAAAKDAGFLDIRTGPSDGAALVELMARDGVQRALHLRGEDHIALPDPGFEIVARDVYAAVAADALPPEARAALTGGALALLYSPRAARLFAELVDGAALARDAVRIAAISPAALAAAGPGWRLAAAAARPSDDALLELAAELCQTAANKKVVE